MFLHGAVVMLLLRIGVRIWNKSTTVQIKEKDKVASLEDKGRSENMAVNKDWAQLPLCAIKSLTSWTLACILSEERSEVD